MSFSVVILLLVSGWALLSIVLSALKVGAGSADNEDGSGGGRSGDASIGTRR